MDYKIIYARRKTISLHIENDGKLTVRAPYGTPEKIIEDVIKKHGRWIENTGEKIRAKTQIYDNADINALKRQAKNILPGKVEYYGNILGVKPTGVKINQARTRFGSCSGKNSINFSCFLMLYPEEAIDYVVVHELCHILHHDHSKEFYKEVEKILPDYKRREKMLKSPFNL